MDSIFKKRCKAKLQLPSVWIWSIHTSTVMVNDNPVKSLSFSSSRGFLFSSIRLERNYEKKLCIIISHMIVLQTNVSRSKKHLSFPIIIEQDSHIISINANGGNV